MRRLQDYNQNPFHVWFKVVDVRKSGYFFPTVKYTPLASLSKLQMVNPFQRLKAPLTHGFGWVPTRLHELGTWGSPFSGEANR